MSIFKFLARLFRGRKKPVDVTDIDLELPDTRVRAAVSERASPAPTRTSAQPAPGPAAPPSRLSAGWSAQPAKPAPRVSRNSEHVFTERRKMPRDIPVPEVSETNTDTAWAKFD